MSQQFHCYRARKALVVKTVLMVDQVLLDPPDHPESREYLDPREALDSREILESLDTLDLLEDL